MSEQSESKQLEKQCEFEHLEDRRVFSGQSIADIALETQVVTTVAGTSLGQTAEVTSSTLATEAVSDAKYVEQQYGFDGQGQTVAVIDSGIAWDHYALGGGLGEGYRVVGGWDFAENDADPYDDGGAGFHGTHVSGIIGSSDETHRGVSSGVDLVGLRVFDDAGNGNIDWVEKALQWVHENKDAFENPITTVNLSLGTEWNSTNVPEWATLEDEFAQLEADGIFVAVAAGNAFQDYNQVGLSYPAASDYVVPVASHGADGTMSDFSQRAQGVLVAPGESIKSTVPDHLFGGTQNGAFAGSTGTSMASPYVAGASTIARQAMEFMGYDEINQDAIYQIFRDTADDLYDSVTNQTYDRINLRAAIDSIIGDQHGESFAQATDIGTVLNNDVIRGTIGKVSDVDAFEFTATHTGTITFDIQSSHDLVAQFELQGGQVSVEGSQVTFDVQQGQQYQFAIRTGDGIGHYQINTTVTEGAPAIDWGAVEQSVKTGVRISGEELYKFTAGRGGIMTLIGQSDSGVRFQLFNQQMVEQTATTDANGQIRFDVGARTGDTFYLKAIGDGEFDVSLSNLVSLHDGKLSIHGTSSSDSIQVKASNQFEVEINSVNYRFGRGLVDSISVDAGAGFDSVRVELDDANDQVTLGQGTIHSQNSDFRLNAINSEQNTVFAGGGFDRLRMEDSAGNDAFSNQGKTVAMLMDGMANYGVGFDFVRAVSSSGNDSATIQGTAGNDKLVSKGGLVTMTSQDVTIQAGGFDRIVVDGRGGFDSANLFDSKGDDQFVLRENQAVVSTSDFELTASSFERLNAFASQGNDSVVYYDSAGSDWFYQRNDVSAMSNGSYTNVAFGFDTTSVNSIGGRDIAQVFGSNQSDTVRMHVGYVAMQAGNDSYEIRGFERTNVVSGSGGKDVAFIYGTEGSDSVYADPTGISMASGDVINRAVGFDSVTVDGKGGDDHARLIGSSGTDRFTANRHSTVLDTGQATYLLRNFERQHFDGREGFDVVALSDFDQNDLLEGYGNSADAKIGSTSITADNFSFMDAATDLVSKYDMSAADYLFMLDGDWEELD